MRVPRTRRLSFQAERRSLDHRDVPDDEADVGAADGGERRSERVERRVRPLRQDRGVRAEAVLHEPGDGARLLDRFAPGEGDDD
jgi:hypothetical protein